MNPPVGTPDPVDELCFFHGYEPSRPGDFRCCIECGHVWRTREEYLADVASLVAEMSWPMPKNASKDDLPFCPLCSHDW